MKSTKILFFAPNIPSNTKILASKKTCGDLPEMHCQHGGKYILTVRFLLRMAPRRGKLKPSRLLLMQARPQSRPLPREAAPEVVLAAAPALPVASGRDSRRSACARAGDSPRASLFRSLRVRTSARGSGRT